MSSFFTHRLVYSIKYTYSITFQIALKVRFNFILILNIIGWLFSQWMVLFVYQTTGFVGLFCPANNLKPKDIQFTITQDETSERLETNITDKFDWLMNCLCIYKVYSPLGVVHLTVTSIHLFARSISAHIPLEPVAVRHLCAHYLPSHTFVCFQNASMWSSLKWRKAVWGQ